MITDKTTIDKYLQLKKNMQLLPISVDELKITLAALEAEIDTPTVYSNVELYVTKNRELSAINYKLNLNANILSSLDLIELAISTSEQEDEELVSALLQDAISEYETLRNILLLNGRYDTSNAIVTIHAGAGGTEACDWTDMVYRMYLMYCQKIGYKVEELDRILGDGAGIKSITFRVSGEFAYGYLKAEKGIHRLVRISPFDANKRRHTSFTSVEVLPEFTTDSASDIVIRDEDIEIGTFRSSGAGGQHVNKTESAIRILHKPTGIVVKCQEERSQTQNKEKAFEKLKQLLIIDREEKQREEISQLQGKMKKIEWGSQIRSYVFCPYTLVKDHRTNTETSDIQKVMNGDIQEFINQYLMSIQQ